MAETEFDYRLIANMSERSETFKEVFDHAWESPAFLKFIEEMELASRHDNGVLILGPTGSGKSTVAKCIHQLRTHRKKGEVATKPTLTGLTGTDAKSRELRRDYGALFTALRTRWNTEGPPFQHQDLARMSMTSAHSELFGHTPGAFTDAKRLRPGALLSAHGGTLFLDEVADASAVTQKALLDFLDNKCFKPEGGDFEIHVKADIIAATNKDPMKEIQGGSFRDDLYFRLASHIMIMPSLFERLDDFDLLAKGLLARQVGGATLGTKKPGKSFGKGVLSRLKEFGGKWPGNIRQLGFVISNALSRAGEAEQIEEAHLPDRRTFYHHTRLVDRQDPVEVINNWLPTVDFEVLKERYIRALNDEFRGNIDRMAEKSGFSRSTFYRWRKKEQELAGG
jgi:DNA-binding NtrC family response regulator